MLEYVSGAISMGYLVSALFFLRFWRRTGEFLFVIFACAFGLLAVNQGLLAVAGLPREEQSWIYLLRLAAFILIIIAIVAKNLGRARKP